MSIASKVEALLTEHTTAAPRRKQIKPKPIFNSKMPTKAPSFKIEVDKEGKARAVPTSKLSENQVELFAQFLNTRTPSYGEEFSYAVAKDGKIEIEYKNLSDDEIKLVTKIINAAAKRWVTMAARANAAKASKVKTKAKK